MRKTPLLFAVALLAAHVPAHAQFRLGTAGAGRAGTFVTPVPPLGLGPAGTLGAGLQLSVLPTLSPGLPGLGAPTLTAAPNVRSALPAIALAPALPGLAAPAQGLSAAPLAAVPAIPAAALGHAASYPSIRKAAALPTPPGLQIPVRAGLDAAAKRLEPASGRQAGEANHATLGQLFNGARAQAPLAFSADVSAQRPPDWSEDRRINAALKTLGRSRIGLDLYQNVYQRYGSNLGIRVDDDPSASYDARLIHENGRPVLLLTEKLVDRESSEVIAAYIAREFTELYLEAFPVSTERVYLGYGNMVRVYAELTDSGLARYGYWWNTSKDHRQGDAYVMQRFFGSWKEAVQLHAGGGKATDSAFFRFLRDRDTADSDPRTRQSLYDQYQRGAISYDEYRRMSDYFDGYVRDESGWLSNTGRW